VSASYRNTICKTIMPLFYGAVKQLQISLVQFVRDALLAFVSNSNPVSITLPCIVDQILSSTRFSSGLFGG